MKKLLSFRILLFMFFVMSMFSACNKNENLSPEAIVSSQNSNEKIEGNSFSKVTKDMTQLEQEEFAKYYLSAVSKGILGAVDARLKTLVYKQVNKKFDGDNNVLIATLLNEAKSVNYNLEENINQSSKSISPNYDFVTFLNAFKDISGQNFYPQIYIPFYEDLKSQNRLGKNQVTIIPFIATEEKSKEFIGYSLGDKGNIIEIAHITEEYARENEVWVISLSETVDSEGKSKMASLSSGRTEATEAINQARFTSLGVQGHRESWVNGVNEVCIRSVLGWGTGVNPYTGITEPSYYILNGNSIHQFAKWEADGFINKPISFVYMNGWDQVNGTPNPVGAKGNFVYYSIYEDDAWPVPLRESTVIAPVSGGIPIYIPYRSADWRFDENTISYAQAVTIGLQRTSNDLKFTLGLL